MKLIIAEKPSVAFAIAKALDVSGKKDGYIEKDKYVISWCVGHLVSLAEPQAYDEKYSKWNYADFISRISLRLYYHFRVYTKSGKYPYLLDEYVS